MKLLNLFWFFFICYNILFLFPLAGQASSATRSQSFAPSYVTINGNPALSKIVFHKERGKKLTFLKVQIKNINNFNKALFSYKNNIDVPLPFQKTRDGSYFLLPSSEGIITLKGENNYTQEFHVSPITTRRSFKVSKTCRIPGLNIHTQEAHTSSYFGGISCSLKKLKSEKKLYVYFSAAMNAEWMGSNLFEKDGKGERWKVFLIPLNGEQKKFDFRWGVDDKISSLKINISTPLLSAHKEAPPSFYVGLNLIQQSFTSKEANNSTASSTIDAAAHIHALYPFYQQLRMRGEASYFIYKIAGEKEESAKYTQLYLGLDYLLNNSFFFNGAFESLSFSIPKLNLLVDFEAPHLSAGYQSAWNQKNLEFLVFYSQPISGGSGDQRMGLQFSISPFFFINKTKLFLKYETLALAQPVSLTGNKISINYLFGF